MPTGTRNSLKMLLMPGDGIGPEIVRATVGVLEALDRRYGLGFAFSERHVGFAGLERDGSTFPDAALADAKAADGVILGPTDTAAYPPPEAGGVNPSAGMRKRLDLFANVRPSRTRPGVPAHVPKMDLVVVRENTEGFYADRNMFQGQGEFMPSEDMALAVRKITRHASTRVAETAFRLAERRRKHVIIVHKANVLKMSDGLFRDSVLAVAAGYPGVTVEEAHVDSMASLLVREPQRFDVIVSTNMFGDILSNLAAELSGGLGLAGSLNEGATYAIAQASHGSAPDIAGKDVANPTAILWSTAMLLDWMAGRQARPALAQAAACLELNLDALLAEPLTRTVDLGGKLGTSAFGQALAERIAAGG